MLVVQDESSSSAPPRCQQSLTRDAHAIDMLHTVRVHPTFSKNAIYN